MNLPNKITLSRIILLPFIVFFYLAEFLNPYGKIIAFAIFIIAALTDRLDGYYARKLNMTTTLGVFLDTNADKLLTSIGLLLVVCDGTIPMPYGVIVAIIFVGRDIVVSALKQLAASKNYIMCADNLGRIKAGFQMVAIPALMLSAFLKLVVNNNTVLFVYDIVAWSLLGIATALTIISMINYLIKNKNLMKEDKKEETAE